MRTARVEIPQRVMAEVDPVDLLRLVELVGAVPECTVHEDPTSYVRVFTMTAEHDDDEAIKVCGSALAALARGELHRYFQLVDTGDL